MKKRNLNVKTKTVKKNILLKKSKVKKIYKAFRSKIFKILGTKSFAVGVSGGSDSLCLAYFCKLYELEFKNKIHFFIVNHNIRKESYSEALKVKNILKTRRIQSKVLSWKGKIPKSNIQLNAREMRYSLISEQCYKNSLGFLVIAHHKDDQVENFLIRLFRGSGLNGLSSMSEKVNYDKNLKIIRPLLDFDKKDLKYVTKQIFKTYIVDPSNDNDIFLRSRIRKYRQTLENEGLDTKKIIKTVNNLMKAKNALEFYKKEAIKKYVKFTSKEKCIINMDLLYKETEEIIFRSFSDIFSLISDSYYPPRSRKVLNLIERVKKRNFKKSTLSSCLIEKSKNFIFISKENKKIS